MKTRIAVIGGGAAGFFSAISAGESGGDCEVELFEQSDRLLAKVKISGGGRCNVTHACFEPRELIRHYPRGSRELLGPFHIWQPTHTIQWFESRGVRLKTEDDGRMFPVTDSSTTIMNCLISAADEAGVKVSTNSRIEKISVDNNSLFTVHIRDQPPRTFDRVIIATGGGKQSGGIAFAKSLGHTITELAPSLFTFHCRDHRITDLQGLSVPMVTVRCAMENLEQQGPLLITHWGFSGPAILRLSAWGARALARLNYTFTLNVNWTGGHNSDMARVLIEKQRQANGRKMVGATCPFDIPRRIWERLVRAVGIPGDLQWSRLNRQQILSLCRESTAGSFQIKGKSMNKEEFVTCGGVDLREVDFRTMQSRLVPGLFFAGEVLDIDGVTGGFNFQAAWTTGHIAGKTAAAP